MKLVSGRGIGLGFRIGLDSPEALSLCARIERGSVGSPTAHLVCWACRSLSSLDLCPYAGCVLAIELRARRSVIGYFGLRCAGLARRQTLAAIAGDSAGPGISVELVMRQHSDAGQRHLGCGILLDSDAGVA